MDDRIYITEASLVLPRNKKLQKFLADILDYKDEEEQILAEQADSVTKEAIATKSRMKGLWDKRAKRLAIYKKRLAEKESQRA